MAHRSVGGAGKIVVIRRPENPGKAGRASWTWGEMLVAQPPWGAPLVLCSGRLPTHFHLLHDLIGKPLYGFLLSRGHALATFRDKICALDEVIRELTHRHKSIFH